MPATTKLLVVGAVAVAAVGLALSGYLTSPGRDVRASPARKPAVSALGYLAPAELPDSVALLPPPPAPGSDAMKADEAARAAALPLVGTPRYALAAGDAARDHPSTVAAFECAFGTAITAQRTPKLYELLARIRLDVRATSYLAKGRFNRARPFVVHNGHTCYPADEGMERADGSYPSARGAVGWAYAEVLAKLRPERRDIILQRGRDFAQSRIVCDQEWASDVEAGKTIAEVALGHIDAKPAFQDDFDAARREVAAEVAAGVGPSRNCRPERLALASR